MFWLKDDPPSPQGYGATRSLEDSANLAGLSSSQSNMPGFPRHTQGLGASRRKAGSHYRARPALDPDIIAQEIVEYLEAALSQFAAIASDLKQ